MATQIQFRRGTKTQHVSFTGATAEVTVNTTDKSLHVHDGTTQGGFELARADLSNHSGVGVLTATTFVGALTGTASNVTTNANLTGDITSTGNATAIATGVIVNADINASAGIVDTKLATIATALKVSNSATTATNANTASAIVARDGSGNFSAGTITANLTGTASNVTTNANLTGHVTSVGNAAVLGSFTSANLATALTDETGSGANVFATSPTLVTPLLGTPTSGNLANCTFPTLNQSTTGNAATVTTNANLTGDITSVGNATAIATGVIVNADINASAAIAVSKLAASTISGVTLGNNLNALTISTGLSGSSYNGSGAITIAIDSTVATLTGTQTLTNKTLTSPTLTTPVLGTPSSGTLTSCTGLPITGITSSTTIGLGVGSIELGNATDTTITRVSTGRIAVEGINVVTTSSTDTLTNKTLTSPTLTTPVLGTPSSGNLANCTFPTLNQNTSGSAATLTTGRTIAITGDLTYTSPSFNGSGNVTAAGTLATVNANVGSFGNGTSIPTITVNAKGLITAVSTTVVTSGTTITNDTTTNASRFLTFTSATSGSISAVGVSSTKLIYNPSTGALSATDFNSTSDINLKENIKIIENPIEKVSQLNGVSFDWKDNHQSSAGVIAQEVEKVLPEIIRENDGSKSVNYNGLIGLLIEAIKEQQKQIDELKANQ